MNANLADYSRSPYWFRRNLDLFWVVAAILLFAEILRMFLFQPELRAEIWHREFLGQGGVLLGISLLMELLFRIPRLRSDYTLITGSFSVMATLITYQQDIVMIPVLLMVPFGIAVLSFKKSRIIFSCVVGVPAFLLLALFLPDLALLQDINSFVTYFWFSLFFMLLAYWFVARFEMVVRHLESAHEAHQELLVQNIIMDKLFKMDALTELYNHKTFHEYLERLIEQGERNGLPLQLAILDLDSFKKVNDTYGHHVGDQVLMRTAAILRQQVTPNDFVARYGGEEFAIIFTEKTLTESWGILEDIRQAMERLQHEELGFRPVTCSIGLEAYKPGMGKDQLFQSADASLYTAKKRGKNQIACLELGSVQSSHS